MKFQIQVELDALVFPAKEGGFWAEVPSLPGCVTEAETRDELLANLREAAQACLSVELEERGRDAIASFSEQRSEVAA